MSISNIFFTARFLRFCTVGASGVVVNLGVLALLTLVGVHQILASAIAIEISILSNFAANEFWTFKDRGVEVGRAGRLLQFQLVSLVGAVVQFCVFILTFFCWAQLFGYADASLIKLDLRSWISTLHAFILKPPEIGIGMYFSQLLGIAAATGWNFAANLYWTWRERELV